MAKITACYQLCPFMAQNDQSTACGVSDDCESGYVIATLGKNIVIRYRISDQKQVNSWNTTVKLSAPVIFDKKRKHYVGVFNAIQIQLWTESDVDLHKVKKYKFRSRIHCVLTNPEVDTPVVVFKNGLIASLDFALENRKSDIYCDSSGVNGTIGTGEAIVAAHLISVESKLIVAQITSNVTTKESRLYMRPVEDELFLPFSMLCNKNGDTELMGCTFTAQLNCIQLLTVWSDGSLYKQELCLSALDSLESQYPGHLLMKITAVDTKLKVAILPLSCDHIAVYGSDPGEEGAQLIIVNIGHRLMQCKYFFKLYCMSPRLWSAGPTALLLIVGSNLAVAHYRLVTQQLATLIGTQTESIVKPVSVDWSSADMNQINNVPEISDKTEVDIASLHRSDQLEARILALVEEGLSEALISEKLFPGMLERANVELLSTLYKNLKNVPVEYYFKTLDLCFTDSRNENWKDLVTEIFSRSIQNDNASLSIIRKELSLSTALVLINSLTEHLIAWPCCLQRIEWATFIIDAFCQQFLLLKDDSIRAILTDLKNVIDNQVSSMKVWQELTPLINAVNAKQQEKKSAARNGKSKKKSKNTIYAVEELPLYSI